MIPSTTNRLLITEDWKKIYQTFSNAEFQSYDFETLRRTMINYLRENYPEDFNDYIDSSEFVALIDLIAFLGQNLSFRIDLNARENFLETAERRESILRLARLINYNAKRNEPASGLLKITSVSTTENVIDSNGINLSNSIIGWNDPTNNNWYQQFIAIVNSVMVSPSVFGKPVAKQTIDGIPTEQYKINTNSSDVPVYSFNKNIGGTQMSFELVSSTFENKNTIYEQPPKPGQQFGVMFKNDNKGSGSANTGFFVHFRQGSLAASNFSVINPVPNEIIGVNVSDINDTDVWLWKLSADGTTHQDLWTKVSTLTGNNIIYNSLSKDQRNIYGVITRENDQVDLSFADGSFGNLPNGPFKLYYRQSNGLLYSIKPDQMNNISVQIPYTSKSGQSHSLTIILSLQYTVTNSVTSETNADIKIKAPQAYYVQNRMITAEDYNIAPLTVNADILKVKSINRVSSGISKYFELSDITGKYSKTNIFANDGILYKEDVEHNFEFAFNTRNEIVAIIKSQLSPVINSPSFKAFYLDHYSRPDVSSIALNWVQTNKTTNQTRGYFTSATGPVTLGAFGSNVLSFFAPGALIKFNAPTNFSFSKGKIVPDAVAPYNATKYMWSQIANVTGDGANSGKGNLDDGTGPVILTGNIPGTGGVGSSAVPVSVIPKFQSILTYAQETEIVNLAFSKRNFGLSLDLLTRTWYIVSNTNLDLLNPFSLVYQKDVSNVNKDASWMIAFEWTGKKYKVRCRSTSHIFESDKETAFFLDSSKKNYDFTTDTIIKDCITVLSINTNPTAAGSLLFDQNWQIDSAVIEADGYIEPKKVMVSFFDYNDDGQIDDPDTFTTIVNPEYTNVDGFKDQFVYFKTSVDGLRYAGCQESIEAAPTEFDVATPVDGQLYYFYDINVNVIKRYSISNGYTLEPSYYAKSGRAGLKFHYVHNSSEERRIDPSKSNIMDVYLLTKTYDVAYRNWVASGTTDPAPLAPTTQSLEENYAGNLESIKGISDEIIYHPANYKVLFGAKAVPQLQATFKAVSNSSRAVSTTDIQTRIYTAIQDFFDINNWEFGQSFNFGELATYVMNVMTPDIINFVIVPKMDNSFGSLYQISCESNEIFVNGATVNDIEVITSLTSAELKATSIVTGS